MASTTTTIRCPGISCGGHCDGETVEVRTAKTARVEACSYLRGQGWIGWHQLAYTPAMFADHGFTAVAR